MISSVSIDPKKATHPNISRPTVNSPQKPNIMVLKSSSIVSKEILNFKFKLLNRGVI